MIITIDGPAGTGKSTVAKLVAKQLNYNYFDTGVMYRSITLMLLRKGVKVNNEPAVEKILSLFDFNIKLIDEEPRYFIGYEDVTDEVRSQLVTENVSEVSASPLIRHAIVKIQRQFATHGNSVFEGRDMGSFVFKEAEKKFFLTADSEIRAKRRSSELSEKGIENSEQEVLQAILKRDYIDSNREISPLVQPEDAFVLDTSYLTIQEVVEKIILFIEQAL